MYSILLKQNLYIPAQLLAKPYAAFYAIGSTVEDFGDLPPGTIDLNDRKSLGTFMVLKDFFKTCAAFKLTDRFVPSY